MGGYYDRLICLIVGLFWTGAGVLGFTTEWGGLQLFLISEEIAIEKLHGVGPVWIHWMKMIALPVAIIGLGNLVGAWLDSGSVLRLHSLVAARGTSRLVAGYVQSPREVRAGPPLYRYVWCAVIQCRQTV